MLPAVLVEASNLIPPLEQVALGAAVLGQMWRPLLRTLVVIQLLTGLPGTVTLGELRFPSAPPGQEAVVVEPASPAALLPTRTTEGPEAMGFFSSTVQLAIVESTSEPEAAAAATITVAEPQPLRGIMAALGVTQASAEMEVIPALAAMLNNTQAQVAVGAATRITTSVGMEPTGSYT